MSFKSKEFQITQTDHIKPLARKLIKMINPLYPKENHKETKTNTDEATFYSYNQIRNQQHEQILSNQHRVRFYNHQFTRTKPDYTKDSYIKNLLNSLNLP